VRNINAANTATKITIPEGLLSFFMCIFLAALVAFSLDFFDLLSE
jgi:hypothetical protein